MSNNKRQRIRPASEYVRAIYNESIFNKKFNVQSCKSSYVIEDLPANPEYLLRAIFTNCVLSAVRTAHDSGIKPDRLGVTISSDLLNPSVWIPIREYSPNTVDAILNRFLEVAQSKSREGSLFGEPFTVTTITLDAKSLPKQRQIRGRGRGRTPKNVRHIVKDANLLRVRNNDSYCLFYALEISRVYICGDLSQREFSRYLNVYFDRQRQGTIRLMTAAGIPSNLHEYDASVHVPPVVDYWNAYYNNKIFKVFVFGALGEYKPIYKYGPDNYDTAIALYYNNNHFDGIRCGVGKAVFGRDYYCFSCECPYDNAENHTRQCEARCLNCGRIGAGRPCTPEDNYRQECCVCQKSFTSNDCYQQHHASNYCAKSKKCKECGVIWNVERNTREGRNGHVCGERYCRCCQNFHDKERGCFIKKLKPKHPKACRLIAFDCETTQNTVTGLNKRIHVVNFVSAHVACTICIKDKTWRNSLLDRQSCKICGDFRTVTFSHRAFIHTKVDSARVCDYPMASFARWILTEFDKKYPTSVFSHFGGRFDNIILFREFFNMGYCPEMIRKGNKLYEMKMSKTDNSPEISIRDSYNLMPVALSALPGAFGLQVQDKPFFPHLYNNEENYGRVLPALPPKSDYLYNGMSPEKQHKFDIWYTEHQNEPFDLCEQLASYCTNDTTILMEALIAFRAEFLALTDPMESHNAEEDIQDDDDDADDAIDLSGNNGIDIATGPMTIASASMKHFQLNHLKKEQLAIVPERGYDTANNQSLIALRFMEWYAAEHIVQIQTAYSQGGEKRFGRYTVDGYVATSDTVIEVHGCVWHACESAHHRFAPNTVLPSGKTAQKIREENAERLQYIGMHCREIKVFWECEIHEMQRRDQRMRQSFNSYVDIGPINLKDCYHGGRVAPVRLHYEVPEGWKMKYLDVRSLYPYTNAVTSYPVGHPSQIHVMQGNDAIVNWCHPSDIPVRGILKVFVIPPRYVDVPVLPVKFDLRLLFPLCRSCAQRYPNGEVINNYICPHSTDKERGWVSTVTHIELEEALRNGYRVTGYYRAIEWEEWNDKVFRGYVAEFMAMKTHASGFPEDVITEAEKQQFIEECDELFGIKIDPSKMEHNKAKRTIAKLCNNSLWGRFSLRNSLSKTKVTDSPAVLRSFLDDPKIEVSGVDLLNDETVLITYTPVSEFIEEHGCSNIVLSLWTTSAARLHLLRLMQKVSRAPNAELIYTDTDSVIFAYKITDGCPLSTGPHLGDLSDEYPSHDLVEFVSGGCKQYALRMFNNRTGAEESVLKVRGITLSADACRLLHFESFKEAVLRYGSIDEVVDGEEELEEIIIEYPNQLRPDIRSGTVHSVKISKRYRPIVTKGIVSQNLIVRDFGFKL